MARVALCGMQPFALIAEHHSGSRPTKQMSDWHLSGRRARSAMKSFFNKEEEHSEANHLEDFVDKHPFLGEHTSPFMSAAIKRAGGRFRVVGFPRHAVASGRKIARKIPLPAKPRHRDKI